MQLLLCTQCWRVLCVLNSIQATRQLDHSASQLVCGWWRGLPLPRWRGVHLHANCTQIGPRIVDVVFLSWDKAIIKFLGGRIVALSTDRLNVDADPSRKCEANERRVVSTKPFQSYPFHQDALFRYFH